MRGYALDLYAPVQHVATEMERADHALSIAELAATYTHPNSGDLARVKKHEGIQSDRAATEWLIEQALTKISRYLDDDGDGTYQLAVPFDKIRYERRKLHRMGPRERFEGAFDPHVDQVISPADGERDKGFSDNIRKNMPLDDTELRESMQAFGWVPELPALQDERGFVLVGHRRLAIAAELGITPEIKTIPLGNGEEADVRRFRIAIASNRGAKNLTESDRKRIAKYLYGEYEWSQTRVAEALQVSQKTVSRDLAEGSADGQRLVTTTNRSSDGQRDPGGRSRKKITSEQETEVARRRYELGETREKIAEAMGLGVHQVQLALQRETGRRMATEATTPSPSAEAEQPAELPEPEPELEPEPEIAEIESPPHTCVFVCSICGREDGG